MAKMFYTMEETKVALGKNEEDIKQLAREGRLREFRDGPRLMFKADQVEAVKADMGGGGDGLSLQPDIDPGAGAGLGDSRSASGTGSVLGLADSVGARKSDTAMDIGLSGSAAGMPSPRDSGGTRGGISSGGTRGGISVLDPDQATADPSAQTAMGPQGAEEQLNLDGAGSGSGLLDLTRESDDTSLGAVFDELTPTTTKRAVPQTPSSAMETQAGEDIGLPDAARTMLTSPIYVTQADATTSALGGAALGGVIALFFGAFILIAASMGYRPPLLDSLKPETSLWMYVGVAAALTGIFFVAGLFIGKTQSSAA